MWSHLTDRQTDIHPSTTTQSISIDFGIFINIHSVEMAGLKIDLTSSLNSNMNCSMESTYRIEGLSVGNDHMVRQFRSQCFIAYVTIIGSPCMYTLEVLR